MSFLYPIFFAGIAAVGVPILLHMIRRRAHKQQLFSSLMFLRESRPRFQRRSKIEHWFLLALRCLILVLLAWAFSRPFLEKPIESTRTGMVRRKVILLDTSASMRREGVWEEAASRVSSILDKMELDDRVCILRFDREARSLLGFAQWQSLEPSQRAFLAARQVTELAPTWNPTHLDQGLIAAVKALEEDEINTPSDSVESKEIILVSDLQQGSRVDLLHTFVWPDDVALTVETITSEKKTNATLNLLADKNIFSRTEQTRQRRVRIHNSVDADHEQFVLRWQTGSPETESGSMEVYAAPGESVAVDLPIETDHLEQVQISGDDHAFDNRYFVSIPERREVNILFMGDETRGEPSELSFYLDQAFLQTQAFDPRIQIHPATTSLSKADLQRVDFVILADTPPSKTIDALKDYLQSGKSILIVMKNTKIAATISALAGIPLRNAEEVKAKDYALLSDLDLDHPVLKPFDDPRYSDFTSIHFWKYRRLSIRDMPDAQVLARFDSGDPAWLTLKAGKGQLILMTAGWHPGDSQLALSTKFVPLLYSILEFGGAMTGQQFHYFVGERISLASWFPGESQEVEVRYPDDSHTTLNLEQQGYLQPEMPGVYTIEANQKRLRFAVNVPAGESQTAPMEVEELENMRIRLASLRAPLSAKVEQERLQRANFSFLESRQKLWRWILLGTVLVVLVEIWWAGRLGKSKIQNEK